MFYHLHIIKLYTLTSKVFIHIIDKNVENLSFVMSLNISFQVQ